MNMKVNINSLLDNKNQMLWSKLQEQLKIDVQYHSHTWYACYSQNKDHIIYVPIGLTPDPAAFAHELLHIDLNTRGMELPAGIKLLIWGKSSISMCFTDDLVEHMVNCFNHIKMLPDFLQLGYDRSEFISDFKADKLTDSEVLNIVMNYRNTTTGIYNSKAIDFYIGKYIAVKACPNTSFNYLKNLQSLNDLDPRLFSVLEQFHNKWNAYDKATAPIYISPHSIASDFVEDIEQWSIGKSIQ
jgi:hypothetical protein